MSADHAALLEPLAASIATQGRVAYVAHLFAIIIAFASITFLHIVLGGLGVAAQERVIVKVNGKTITDTDMKLAEAEIRAIENCKAAQDHP